jgi:hypothetical protein
VTDEATNPSSPRLRPCCHVFLPTPLYTGYSSDKLGTTVTDQCVSPTYSINDYSSTQQASVASSGKAGFRTVAHKPAP